MSSDDKPLPPTPLSDEIQFVIRSKKPLDDAFECFERMRERARQIEGDLQVWRDRADRVIKERDRLGRELADMTAARDRTAGLLQKAIEENTALRSAIESPVPLLKRFRDQRDAIYDAAVALLAHYGTTANEENFDRDLLALKSAVAQVPSYAERLDSIFKGLAEAEEELATEPETKTTEKP